MTAQKEMHMGSVTFVWLVGWLVGWYRLIDKIDSVDSGAHLCVCEDSFQDCLMHEPSFHFLYILYDSRTDWSLSEGTINIFLIIAQDRSFLWSVPHQKDPLYST